MTQLRAAEHWRGRSKQQYDLICTPGRLSGFLHEKGVVKQRTGSQRPRGRPSPAAEEVTTARRVDFCASTAQGLACHMHPATPGKGSE